VARELSLCSGVVWGANCCGTRIGVGRAVVWCGARIVVVQWCGVGRELSLRSGVVGPAN